MILEQLLCFGGCNHELSKIHFAGAVGIKIIEDALYGLVLDDLIHGSIRFYKFVPLDNSAAVLIDFVEFHCKGPSFLFRHGVAGEIGQYHCLEAVLKLSSGEKST